ncbi:MAG: PadR family transcriptional regulator [Vicinamibacterales bacterium]
MSTRHRTPARGGRSEDDRLALLQGTLDLLILKTLDVLGPMHGWGIARRIEQVSNHLLYLNQGTIYPALLRLEQRGWIRASWGQTENNRRAKFYQLTRAGRTRLRAEADQWAQMVAVVSQVLQDS